MKTLQIIKVISSALVVLVSFSTYAQSSDATGAQGAMAAPSANGQPVSNHTLEKNVRRALSKTQGLTVENIIVRARNGAVTLEGSVPDGDQIALAAQAAQGVSGVKSVKNALTIRAEGGGQ
ncbi:hyperosmotically inducible protein [Paraburkholderia youngii]|uniref:BON domain-containing protein n=1 Tax=Paraburkholderia youngii TaxID=2782701 RepID=A0A7W8L7N6_9BURK|nr:BON domain-containing protein [Paraburkholderia youngii]MBB5401648.1 osmotically-inducible protein OsmY [Paraburkholderia youngii]NUX58081.1 BON domain-containing protein [Paraburkholderia youngii]NVI09680.1 BON domain-containing protein [Paraburkholderia youngii]